MTRAVACLGLVALLVGASPAAAQVYKYRKKDGTVVFTDKLSDLPKERRAYYNRKKAKAKEKRRRARERMTPEERRAADLEAQRKKILAQELAARERRRRLEAIDAALAEYREKRSRKRQREAFWREKKAKAEARLEAALAEYREARKEWEALATRVGFSLLPGQRARKLELQEKLPKLEAAVDAANTYLTETLPEEARRAGVPPGWLR
jgi:hypothetical protein